MNYIKLIFSESLELNKIVVRHRLSNGEIVSIRGKNTDSFANGSFQWTSAVKAFALLVVENIQGQKALNGGAGSPAASLDYAISKQPIWLRELFGDSLLRFFRRKNSERKNGENVQVNFSSILDDCVFELHVRARRASSAEIADIKNLIINSYVSNAPENNLETRFQTIIQNSLENEITKMIQATNIFSSGSVKAMKDNLCRNLSFQKFMAGKSFNYSDIDLSLSSSRRLGIGNIQKSERTFSIAASGTLVAGLALFRYLNHTTKQFQLDCNYPHAVEIVRQLISGEITNLPDLLILGSAPAARLLSSHFSDCYEPLMFLPKVSHGVVSCKRENISHKPSNSSDYVFIADEPSLPAMIYDEMKTSGYLSAKSRSINLDPDETFLKLRNTDSDLSAILFFPHYHINIEYNSCTRVEAPCELQDCLLLIKKDIFTEDKIFINYKVRDAWLKLLSNHKERKALLDDFKNDKNYLDLMWRVTGMYNLATEQQGIAA